MKIEHLPGEHMIRFVSNGSYVYADRNEIPHECAVPGCPGNRNRLKLEMFERWVADMDHALEYWNGNRNDTAMFDALNHILDVIEQSVSKAKELK